MAASKAFVLLVVVGLCGSTAFRIAHQNSDKGSSEGDSAFAPRPGAKQTTKNVEAKVHKHFAKLQIGETDDLKPKVPTGGMEEDFEPAVPLQSHGVPATEQVLSEIRVPTPKDPQMTARDSEWEITKKTKPGLVKSIKESVESIKESVPVQPAVFFVGGLLLLGAAAYRRQGSTSERATQRAAADTTVKTQATQGDADQSPAAAPTSQARREFISEAAAAAAAFGAAAPAVADVDYDGVKYLGGGDKIDLNNANIRAYIKLSGMYPGAAGKIASYKGPAFKDVKDVYKIPGLTDGEKAVIKQNEGKFIVLEPKAEYVIDRMNNGLYR
jgi:photosystem II PsbU protein